uniref:Uncharacterized protein n=1 Tax=Steinernema glaseri TaxID=37863 RepID=A0A1I7Y3X1_9BILA
MREQRLMERATCRDLRPLVYKLRYASLIGNGTSQNSRGRGDRDPVNTEDNTTFKIRFTTNHPPLLHFNAPRGRANRNSKYAQYGFPARKGSPHESETYYH